MKYRKKQRPIEAIQWTGNNQEQLREITQSMKDWDTFYVSQEGEATLIEMNGVEHECPVGFYVIRDEHGFLRVENQTAFEATYEKIQPHPEQSE